MSSFPPQYTLKLILVGDYGCGKSGLIRRYQRGTLEPPPPSTLCIDFETRVLDIVTPCPSSLLGGEAEREGSAKAGAGANTASFEWLRAKLSSHTPSEATVTTCVRLQIWDTAGQERFRGLVKGYYRGACGVIFVYDVSDRAGFDSIAQRWAKEVNESLTYPRVPMLLVGTRCDLVPDDVEGEPQTETQQPQRSPLDSEQSIAKTPFAKTRAVSRAEGLALADAITKVHCADRCSPSGGVDAYRCEFMEASALLGINTTEVFESMGRRMLEAVLRGDIDRERVGVQVRPPASAPQGRPFCGC